MKTQQHTITKPSESRLNTVEFLLSTVTGALISVAMIAFFLIMKAAGLAEVPTFRHFNGVFLLVGIVSAYAYYKNKYTKDGLDYLMGIRLGLRITLTAIIPFAIFMWLYLRMDSSFMQFIIHAASWGEYLTPITSAAVVGIEGFISGGLVSYIVMPYFKKESTEVSE